MDENILKFSFLFDRNIDGIIDTLPANPSNGSAYFLTTDSRLYFRVSSNWLSSPTPRWFVLVIRTTGELYQFDGSTLVSIESSSALSDRIEDVEITLSTLGSAAFQNVEYFATQASLDVVEASLSSDIGTVSEGIIATEERFEQELFAAGYEFLGNYTADLNIATHKQYFRRGDRFYAANEGATLPYTTTGTWATDSANLVLLGDAVLRQELSSESPGMGAWLVAGSVRHINNMAELKVSPGRYEGDTVRLVSYLDFSPFRSPAGGGEFTWYALSTDDPDDAYTVAVSGVATGRWKRTWEGRIHVDQFGANPFSEAVNSRQAFQDAVTFAQTVAQSEIAFGPGSYMVDRSVDVSTGDSFFDGIGQPRKNGIRFTGAGSWCTSVFCSAANGPFKIFRFDGNKDNNTLNTAPVAQWGSGLSGTELYSDDLTFNPNTAAIYVRACWNGNFHDIKFRTMPGDCIFIDGVTTPGMDDADTTANCRFEDINANEVAGRVFNNTRSRTASMYLNRFRMLNCYQGGIYIAAASAWISNIEGDANGSRGNAGACMLSIGKPLTGASTRNIHVKNVLGENNEWNTIEVTHCDTGSIEGLVLHPYLRAANADVITQPKLVHFRPGAGGYIKNFRVEGVRIQDYSADGSGREFQAFVIEGDSEVKFSGVSKGVSSVPDANMFVMDGSVSASLDGTALTPNGPSQPYFHLQSTAAGAAISGGGAPILLSTQGGTFALVARGLLSSVNNRAKVSGYITSTRAEVSGELAIGGLATTHNRVRVSAIVGGGFPIPIVDMPISVASGVTGMKIPVSCPVPCAGGQELDLEVTVFGSGASVFCDVGTRIRWTLV